MKIVIFYSTLIEDTKESAKILKNLINAEVVLIPIERAKDECILKYNFIVLGASAYNGRVQNSFKIFISRNIKTLLGKPHALYVNGDENLDILYNLNKAFTPELIESSFACGNFGYNINTDRGNFLERRKSKKLIEKSGEIPSLNKEEIENYANRINDIIEKRVG